MALELMVVYYVRKLSGSRWQQKENGTAFYSFTKHFLAGISHIFLTLDHFHTALGPKPIWSLKISMLILRLGKLAFKYYAPHKWNNPLVK